MWSFLTFETLISIQTLMAFYYFGALLMPVLLVWFLLWLKSWLVRKVPAVESGLQTGRQFIKAQTTWQSRFKWGLLFVVAFLFTELFWRLLFEFLIAFMQMRDVLVLGG